MRRGTRIAAEADPLQGLPFRAPVGKERSVIDTDQTPIEASEENLADVHDSATATTEAGAHNDPAPEVKGNREARYRTERNAAREQVATLTARIEKLQRLDIERTAGEVLSAPVDLWMNGNDVAAYLDDDGNVDVERVREDAQLLVTERPGLRKPSAASDPTQGRGGNPGKASPTWDALLQAT
jgi:hypothetical protein